MTLPSSTSAMTHRRSYPQHREPRIRRLTVADSLGRDDFGEEKTSLEQNLARKAWHKRKEPCPGQGSFYSWSVQSYLRLDEIEVNLAVNVAPRHFSTLMDVTALPA